MLLDQEPDRMLAEDVEGVLGGDMLLLGVAHRRCLDAARRRLRAGQVALPRELPQLFGEDVAEVPEEPHVPPRGRLCAFCGNEATLLTDEHVWPKWFSRLMRERVGIQPARFAIAGEERSRPSNVIPITARICEHCNSKWLSTLENDARQILATMIFGSPRQLPVAAQTVIATWGYKTALMIDLASRVPVIPYGFYRDFAINRRPHRNMRVLLAAYAGRAPARAQRECLWAAGVSRNQSPNAFATTFSAGSVLLQVVGHFAKDGSFNDRRGQFVDCTRQIWPDVFDTIAWPPGRIALDDDGFDEMATSFSDR